MQGIRDGEEPGGHAMVIVGYDDRKQAFKLINSWSTDWGKKGFGWVSYDLLEATVANGDRFEAYVMIDEINENSPQEWNWVNKAGYSDETQWVDKTKGRSKRRFAREKSKSGSNQERSGRDNRRDRDEDEGMDQLDKDFSSSSGKPDLW